MILVFVLLLLLLGFGGLGLVVNHLFFLLLIVLLVVALAEGVRGRYWVIDAAHWWGPSGYLYRNTPGNLIASALWAGPAFAVGYFKGWRKHIRPHLQRTRQKEGTS